MSTDDRDILETLKAELDFIEKGGYGRSVRTPWKQTSVFQDSLSCLNFGDPQRTHPCDECFLTDFVPECHMGEEVPCHHIPLNPAGETVERILSEKDEAQAQEAVLDWLKKKIKDLEEERARLRA